MNISIKGIRSATPDEWDLLWWGCPYSTYFQSREWAEIWNIYTKGGMRPEPKIVEFSDGKKALLPLSFQKSCKGLVRGYISSPAGTFGGWISTDELSLAHAMLLTDCLVRLGNLVWRINPYDELAFKVNVRASRDDKTQVLNLVSVSDGIYKMWEKGPMAYKVRKARKGEVWVRLASTLDDWLAYYQVYQDSLRRWGDRASSRYDWRIFNEMFRRESPYIKLWLAIYQNKIVAGIINFYAKKHAVGWHASALAQHFKLYPMNLLVYEIVKDACEKGYSWFGFNPSGGHKGVERFKRSFGAQFFQCPEVIIETNWAKFAKNISVLLRRGNIVRHNQAVGKNTR
ncbi:MAG: GNAT family N-acetyltransferase [Actinobacteria bacterium]|nr:GNAT family N-acetyltransferase [Actinomycetota bacterium]